MVIRPQLEVPSFNLETKVLDNADGCQELSVEDTVGDLSVRVGRFWVLRKVKMCVVPLGAK